MDDSFGSLRSGSSMASATDGPCTLATATARFRATISDGLEKLVIELEDNRPTHGTRMRGGDGCLHVILGDFAPADGQIEVMEPESNQLLTSGNGPDPPTG